MKDLKNENLQNRKTLKQEILVKKLNFEISEKMGKYKSRINKIWTLKLVKKSIFEISEKIENSRISESLKLVKKSRNHELVKSWIKKR